MKNPRINAFWVLGQFLSLVTFALSIALPGQAGPLQPVAQLPTPNEPRSLVPSKTIRDELRKGQSHSYLIKLDAGQYVKVVYKQPSLASVLRLTTGNHNDILVELNLPGGLQPEPLQWIAKISRTYWLEIAASGEWAGSSEYEVKITDLRVALPEDSDRISSQNWFEEARISSSKREYRDALASLEKALSSSQRANDREGEAAALSFIGSTYIHLDENDKAAGYFDRSLLLRREINDRSGEADDLRSLGLTFYGLSENEKAIERYEKALAICRELQDPLREANLLNNLANANVRLGHYENAVAFYQQAQEAFHRLKDFRREGMILGNLAVVSMYTGQFEKAIAYTNRSVEINKEFNDRDQEATNLANLCGEYFGLSRYADAIDYCEQALAIARDIKNRSIESSALANLGDAFLELDEYKRAINYYEQELLLARELGDRTGQASALTNLGIAHTNLEQYELAISNHEEGLAIARDIKDPPNEIGNLNGLGNAYFKLGLFDKAKTDHGEALTIARELKDQRLEADTLLSLGNVETALGHYLAAGEYYEKAIAKARDVKNTRQEAELLVALMQMSKLSNRPKLAIFYGKEAINAFEVLRMGIRQLSSDLRKTFIRGNENPYHTLADLLIAQGRLTEAEQILGLLKEEEYFDFVRRESAESPARTQHADLTPDESAWEKRYQEIGDKLVTLGTERGQLLDKQSLTPAEAARLAQLDQDLAAGNSAFEKFLDGLGEHFGSTAVATAKLEQLRETQGIMEDLRELPKGTVAVYTLIGEDKYRSILVTPDVQKAYEYPITAAELNRKILDFRYVTQNPELDPRALGEELYKILLASLAEDLKQAKATTVMWSLDGALRYLPVAALYDGKQYLVERYALSVFTPASNARLKDRPDRIWTAAGFGVTKAHEGASALPSVAEELNGIIGQMPGSGILQGEVRLDGEFTENTMRQILLKHHQVVHIASHFSFQPGDETNSFLLLGDGKHLSVAELKSLPNLFGGVQLLTLSACNTGVGDTDGDGKEVEGLGVLAQRKGAKSVVASLWSVADVSTSLLMQEFYRIRESSGATKAEALREAQLAMLRGTVKSSEKPPNSEKLHADIAKPGPSGGTGFAFDAHAPYAHPYYWAPFFLMGNWL